MDYREFFKQNLFALGFVGIGLILVCIGIGSMVVSATSNKKGVIIEQAASTSSATLASLKNIMIDVSGSVEHPGVYSLSEDARVQDALIAAGGLSQDANRDYIAKNINLAAKVSDGGKVYIPAKGEGITGIQRTTGGSVAGVSSGLININNASQSELESLPGIGPVTAAKIIENRPYGSVDDLLSKKVVGQSVFSKIKEKISVY